MIDNTVADRKTNLNNCAQEKKSSEPGPKRVVPSGETNIQTDDCRKPKQKQVETLPRETAVRKRECSDGKRGVESYIEMEMETERGRQTGKCKVQKPEMRARGPQHGNIKQKQP